MVFGEGIVMGGHEGPATKEPPRGCRLGWAEGGFLFGAFLFLYLNLFIFPATPLIDPSADEELYLANARRLFDGEVLYRDFTHFTFPGTETLYLGLFNIFGIRPWIGNAMLLLVGLGLTWLMLVISRRLIRGWASFLPPLLFLTLNYRYRLDATHHWYSVLAAMGAVAVLLEKRTPSRLAISGILCGVAAWFTHVRGLLAAVGIAVFLVWEWQETKYESRRLLRNLGPYSGPR